MYFYQNTLEIFDFCTQTCLKITMKVDKLLHESIWFLRFPRNIMVSVEERRLKYLSGQECSLFTSVFIWSQVFTGTTCVSPKIKTEINLPQKLIRVRERHV